MCIRDRCRPRYRTGSRGPGEGMRATLTLGEKSATANLDPRLVGNLCEILRRKTVNENDAVSLLQQVSHFDRNKHNIISKSPGQVVVIGHERVAFSGTLDEAFDWTSENRQSGPFYIAAKTTSQNVDISLLNAMDLTAIPPSNFDYDNRMRLQIGWAVPTGAPCTELEFLIDTGVERSCIDIDNARGMNLAAIVGVEGISATPRQLLLLGGGQMVFAVEDSSSGAVQTIKHDGDVVLASQRLIGQDVFTAQSLTLNMDFSGSPPSIRVVR